MKHLLHSHVKAITIISTIFCLFIATKTNAQWSELGGANTSTFNGPINCLTKDASGNMYAAGYFTNASGKYYVAKWNGNAWSELGGTNALNANGGIASIITDANGNIYATGGFYNANGKGYVAKYSSSSGWSELGGINTLTNIYVNSGYTYNPNGIEPSSLAIDGSGNIYVAEYFYNSSATVNVAKFDGSAWSLLGSGIQLYYNSAISQITSDASGNIYATGAFQIVVCNQGEERSRFKTGGSY